MESRRREMDRQISLEHPEVKGPMRLSVQVEGADPASDPTASTAAAGQIVELELLKRNTAEELIQMVLAEMASSAGSEGDEAERAEEHQLFEVAGTEDGETWKERALDPHEYPVSVQLLI